MEGFGTTYSKHFVIAGRFCFRLSDDGMHAAIALRNTEGQNHVNTDLELFEELVTLGLIAPDAELFSILFIIDDTPTEGELTFAEIPLIAPEDDLRNLLENAPNP